MVYRDCSFVITLIGCQHIRYEAGSQLHIDHGELTAITAAGEKRRVRVHEWQGVMIEAGEILTNRWRRRATADPSTSTR